jgi:hypothetical protein
MGYMKITNLYKPTARIMLDLFREVYAMEKIHGTSAHIKFKGKAHTFQSRVSSSEIGVAGFDGEVTLFSGGEKYERFERMIDSTYGIENLRDRFIELGHEEITIYGEAYGGKQQGMSGTYGPDLKFVAFEVKIVSEHHEKPLWMSVDKAAKITRLLGLEFVHYVRGPATEAFVNGQRDKPSVQAIRNGMGDDKKSEGVVLRPVVELTGNNGKRIIAKHKRDDFRETRSKRTLDPETQKVFAEATATAQEFVVPERLTHVIDALKAANTFVDEIGHPRRPEMKDTGTVIRAVINDVKVEEGDSIVWSKDVERAIGKEAAKVYKRIVVAL